MSHAQALSSISIQPSDDGSIDQWLSAEANLDFLRSDCASRYVVLYANLDKTFIHAVCVPVDRIGTDWVKDLDGWNATAYSTWGTMTSFKPRRTEIVEPLRHTGSQILDSGEQLIYARSFNGRRNGTHYHEVLQKFVHLFGLHYLEERSAYCRFDKHGDLEDVIQIVEGKGTVITCLEEVFSTYLAFTRSVAVRMFDFTRTLNSFAGWPAGEAEYTTEENMFYRRVFVSGYAAYVRGCQIIRPSVSREKATERLEQLSDTPQQYASFIAHDWRHNRVAEISCAPGATANYFTESDLPFEVTPAFFRPEVLAKYKADSDKYRLDASTISCRDAWSLQTYSINDAGQVHTYLVYLRNLPYEEQLYWKAFNENPKGTISKRAFLADFEGSWDLPFDSLESIKNWVRTREGDPVDWWTLRAGDLIDRTRHVTTSSGDEWASEILHLDQLLVEGLQKSALKSRAVLLGRSPSDDWQTIKLLKEWLLGAGLTDEEAKKVVEPFETVHLLRTKLKGHAASRDTVQTLQRKALLENKTFAAHFEVLCTRAFDSLQRITTLSAS